jgi:hypothetical protein
LAEAVAELTPSERVVVEVWLAHAEEMRGRGWQKRLAKRVSAHSGHEVRPLTVRNQWRSAQVKLQRKLGAFKEELDGAELR